jgi:integrase
LGVWTETWIGIVERSRKPSTAKTYRTHIKYLQPLAGVRLDRLTSEHVEQLYVGLLARGVLPVSVQGAHRTYRSCLREAVKRGWLSRNPVTAARPGTVKEREVVPLTIVEARAILAAASQHPNAVKWAIALGLGLRQGEALGLQWADIDLAAGTLSVRRSLRQGRWQHGCGDPGACSARPQNCPRRHGGGLIVGAPKSKRSTRTIVLPRPLQAALKAHRSAQASERLAAGELWQAAPHNGLHTGTGWVFASPVGKSIDPRRDWEAWKNVLKVAGVRDARLHDARHTAATFLPVAGVDTRTVMELLGWC